MNHVKLIQKNCRGVNCLRFSEKAFQAMKIANTKSPKSRKHFDCLRCWRDKHGGSIWEMESGIRLGRQVGAGCIGVYKSGFSSKYTEKPQGFKLVTQILKYYFGNCVYNGVEREYEKNWSSGTRLLEESVQFRVDARIRMVAVELVRTGETWDIFQGQR